MTTLRTRFLLAWLSLLVCLGCVLSKTWSSKADYSPIQESQNQKLLPIQQDFKWGYINRAGEVVIKPQFDSAEQFSEGLALVRYPNREKPLKPGQTTPELILGEGFIDETGKVVLELESPLYLGGDGFYEGLTKFWTGESGRSLYGYIDKTGAIKIKAQFSHAYEFFEGLAAVCLDEKCGFIDKSGTFVIPAKYCVNHSFSDGFAVVGLDHDKVGFINKSGELVIEPQFGNLIGTVFREGLSLVAYPNGKYGYVDKQGTLVIPMQFDHAQPFSEGLAAVSVSGKWGYIDKSGAFVIKPQFRSGSPFSEGLAAVGSEPSLTRTEQTGVGTGFIDKTGKLVIALPFDGATSFVNGIARVYVEGMTGYIDKKGTFIWKPSR